MATLNAEHINPFLMTAKKILQDVCFVEVAIQKPVLKEASFSADDWVIIVGVTGEMRGQVLIAMSEKNACAIASKMFRRSTALHSICIPGSPITSASPLAPQYCCPRLAS